MPNNHRIDNLKTQLEKLRRTRGGHNAAMERKKKRRKQYGFGSMLASLLVSSGLVEQIFGQFPAGLQNHDPMIKFLAFAAALLTGAITLFNYEKESQTHETALETYANLSRDYENFIARAEDGAIADADLDPEIEKLDAAYDKANEDFKGCTPTDKDFEVAAADRAKRLAERAAAAKAIPPQNG